MKIEIYATSNNGDGYVTSIGVFESWEEIQIRCGMFSDDVVISFEVTPEIEV